MDCPSSHIDQATLDSFFNTRTTCNTTIVHLEGERESRDTIKVKQFQSEPDASVCNILFTSKNGYYYVYSFLLQQIIAWAGDPRAFARQGFLGHHTTIGIKKDGTIDMHDTFYNTFRSVNGHLLIAKTSTKVFYHVNNKNQLVKRSGTKSIFESANQELWNDIKCHQRTMQSGSGKSVRKIKLLNAAYMSPQKKTRTKLSETINARISEANKHLVGKYTFGAISIPYIAKHVEKRILKLLKLSSEHKYTLFSCHEANTKCSVICINMF